ncbi:hypothetical protein N657DRAFT_645692 [Parathielavia appendiculata]|uniref:Myb-like domain-containing protein n=1 Tax=Parathielavia appendiculata TaxID=2587402 RepID=A0AAN6TY96_9PEZI|nr:hypothetical protein N657DRAFT_645692 [Parathielavia appendiculata]
MSRTRGPPRRASRDKAAGLGLEETQARVQQSNVETRRREYRPIAAQPPTSAPGPDPFRYPPSSAGLLPPTNPDTAPAGLRSKNTQMEDVPTDAEHLASGCPGSDTVRDETAALAEYTYSIYNHGTWTAEDDRTLIQARTRGQNWADLQRTHFPTKTANACRKRYERLVERQGIHDHSGRRLEMVANEYMNMRKEIWSPLANRLEMKWEVVEALCMGAGLRAIQSNARSYTNRARRDNRISQKTREAQADAASVGPVSGALPVGTEFGTAFTGRGYDQLGHADRGTLTGNRSNTGLMPPPPFIPGPGHANSTCLPPIIPTPQVSFQGHMDGTPWSLAGPSRPGAAADPPLSSSRPPGWQGTNFPGPG